MVYEPDWDASYRAGDWDYFRSVEQLPRYAILVAYILRFCRGGRLLDVGCGEGVLREQLPSGVIDDYVGVDISSVAIERARQRTFERTLFECSDLRLYGAGAERFDGIIFSEVLQTFSNPLEQLRRFHELLSPQGVVMASIFDPDFPELSEAVKTYGTVAEQLQHCITHDEESDKRWHAFLWRRRDGR